MPVVVTAAAVCLLHCAEIVSYVGRSLYYITNAILEDVYYTIPSFHWQSSSCDFLWNSNMELLAWNIWPTVKCLATSYIINCDHAVSIDLFILGTLITLPLCQAACTYKYDKQSTSIAAFMCSLLMVRDILCITLLHTSARVPQPVVWHTSTAGCVASHG